MHAADYGLRCSVRQEVVWLHGEWCEECCEACGGEGGGGGELSGRAALYPTGLSFPGQYWGLMA